MSRIAQSGALAALLVALVGALEGIRLTAYPDPATGGRPWTICHGSTQGVRPGDRRTIDQCRALLRAELEHYASGIERCVTAPLPDRRYVALVSFAYNVGVAAACGSSVIGLINAGETRAGCDALLKWNRAAGIVFPGLTRRRLKERALCLEDA